MANDKYEVVVAGAGVGGLCSAALLAHYGYKVLLVEALERLGGRLSTVDQEGFKTPTGAVALPSRGGEAPQKPSEPVEPSERWKGIADAGSTVAAGLDADEVDAVLADGLAHVIGERGCRGDTDATGIGEGHAQAQLACRRRGLAQRQELAQALPVAARPGVEGRVEVHPLGAGLARRQQHLLVGHDAHGHGHVA